MISPGIYAINKDGTPPTKATKLTDVEAVGLGKFSLVQRGAWALVGRSRDVYFFNVTNYDKRPWLEVPSDTQVG